MPTMRLPSATSAAISVGECSGGASGRAAMSRECLFQVFIAFASHGAGTALAGILAVLLAGGLDMKATLAVRGRCGSSFFFRWK